MSVPFEITNNKMLGMRNDIGEKFLTPDYYTNVENFNYDPIIGADKIKDKLALTSGSFALGHEVDGAFEYRFLDSNNNNLAETVFAVSGYIYRMISLNSNTSTFVRNEPAGSFFQDAANIAQNMTAAWNSPVSGDILRIVSLTSTGTDQTQLATYSSTWTYSPTSGQVVALNSTMRVNPVTIDGRSLSLYWIPIAFTYAPIYPRPLTALNLPLTIGRCDFASYQNKLFIFNGQNYPLVYYGEKGGASFMGAPLPNDLSLTSSSISGNVSGSVQYAQTYVVTNLEENTGTYSQSTQSLSSTQVELDLPIGYAGVTSRKVYRTPAGSSTFYLLTTIPDNTTLSYIDNISDTSLLLGEDLTPAITDFWPMDSITTQNGSYCTPDGKGTPPGNFPVRQMAGTMFLTSGLISNAIYATLTSATPQYDNYVFQTDISPNFTPSSTDDFTLYGISRVQNLANTYEALEGIAGTTKNILFQVVDNSGTIPNTTSGDVGKLVYVIGNTIAYGNNLISDNVYFMWWFTREAGVNNAGFSNLTTSGSFNSTPEVTLVDNFDMTGGVGQLRRNCQIPLTSGLSSTTVTYDEARWLKGRALSSTNLAYIFSQAQAGIAANNGGPVTIPAINNKCPKVYHGIVAADRLMGAVSDKNANQAWITDTFVEVFKNNDYIDVTGQANDNTPLVGIATDYRYVIAGSQKNLYLIDPFVSTPPSTPTRANVGVYNGYTMKNLPPYKGFEGGIMFMSTLKDFRIFNSNFSQPLIATSQESNQDENWSRAIDATIKSNATTTKQAEFFEYKYHVSFGNTVAVFDIRNSGWSIMTNQDINCMTIANNVLMAGRTASSSIDQLYALNSNDNSGVIASGALTASSKEGFFADLLLYYLQNGNQTLSMSIVYEDDYPNAVIVPINIQNSQVAGTSQDKTDYVVVHLNRRARWMKWTLTSNKGRFMYRGYSINGDKTDKN